MKLFTWKILAALLCLALLCGCASNNNADEESVDSGKPVTGVDSGSNTQTDDTAAVPDESGDDSGDENADQGCAALTSEELAWWGSYFNTRENNGLLRFPYKDPAADPDQLAPYLKDLFYDNGEPESQFSVEELALLAETDLWLELDSFRLSREFINSYLYAHFNISAEKTEDLLDAAKLGVYLLEYDAWYFSHGDTAYNPYAFNRGEVYEDGSVKLFYFNDFLTIAQENGEDDYIDAEMIVTLMPREDGTWYIVSHEINGGN